MSVLVSWITIMLAEPSNDFNVILSSTFVSDQMNGDTCIYKKTKEAYVQIICLFT